MRYLIQQKFLLLLILTSLSGCLSPSASSTLPPVASGNIASDPADEPAAPVNATVQLNPGDTSLITYQGSSN